MKHLPFEYPDIVAGDYVNKMFEKEKLVVPEVKHGDLWKLGDHFVTCGDCTRQEDVVKRSAEQI